MNLIRWIVSTLLTSLLLPSLLGLGGKAQAAPMPPELQRQIEQLAGQVEAQGGQLRFAGTTFLVVASENALAMLEDGLAELGPFVAAVERVKSAASAPEVLPPGAKLALVSLSLAHPVTRAR